MRVKYFTYLMPFQFFIIRLVISWLIFLRFEARFVLKNEKCYYLLHV